MVKRLSDEELDAVLSSMDTNRQELRHRKNIDLLERRWEELLLTHPNEWVLVDDEEIIGFANPGGEQKLIESRRLRKGELSSGVLRFLDPDPPAFILSVA